MISEVNGAPSPNNRFEQVVNNNTYYLTINQIFQKIREILATGTTTNRKYSDQANI